MKAKYEQLKKDVLFEQEQLDVVILKIREIENNISETNIAAMAA